MNLIDLTIIAALGLAVYSGYRRGAILQMFSWGGFLVGIVIAGVVAPPIVRAFSPNDPLTRAIVGLGAFLGVAFIVEALVAFGGSKVAGKVTAVRARQVDRAVGSVVAGTLLLTTVWFLSLPGKRVTPLAKPIRESAVLRAMYGAFQSPPDIMAGIGNFLSHTGFPEVFAQLNPSLAPGVAPPDPSVANNTRIRAAATLTYKIESRGCDGRVSGSGFPARRDLVITAAHVVAGTRATDVIEARSGARYRGVVVYMDTNRDIAVIRVPDLPNRTLPVDDDAAARQTQGAAIGYPGGGPQKISAARVRARTNAVGYDIYSRSRVSRSIYVLRAVVKQGNSGGPFVDEEGRVRGMIFAASAQNAEESYALTEIEIARALARAGSRAVSTRQCAI